jgi:hypothetical protein
MLRLISFVLLSTTLIFSQTATSLMQGTVTDSSGAAIPDVRVAATLANTDTSYRTVSNANGNYVIPNIRPGQYDISFEHPSFKRAVRTGVLIEVNQSARVDMALQVGEVKESVSVSADTTTVDTYTATINETVDSKRMVDLPLNGRQALQLQAIMPGVVPGAQGQAASLIAVNTYLTFSVNGTRPSGSFYALDGAVNMDMYNNTPAAFPNPDALQEFSMLTNSYTAVYGGDAGAVVNAVTKAGTNSYHGGLYEFLRNTDLNTRNFFANTRPPLHKNQFGGNMGGPIIHNKTFFFGSYEGNRQVQATTSSGNVVPTALERQGNFSQSKLPTGPIRDPNGIPYPGNIVPTSLLNPVAEKFASDYLPLPNASNNTFTYNLPIPYNDDQFIGRLDHNISDRNHVMLRYFFDDTHNLNNDALLVFNSEYDWVTHNAALSDQFVFNPTTTNTATLTFNRNTFIRAPLATAPDPSWASLGCTSCVVLHPPSVPTDWNLSITSGVGIRSSTDFNSYMQNWEFIDSFNKNIGNHLLTIGGSIVTARRNGREYFDSSPVFTFDGSRTQSGSGYADFFTGLPVSVVQNTILQSYTSKIVPSAFFEDDWKATRKLTLNLGFRWEPYLPLTEKHDHLQAFRPGEQSQVFPTAPLGLVFPGDPGISRGVVQSKWAKFGPRFGFAWDPFGNGKTSIRGGYGIFYDTPRLVAYNSIANRQPFSVGTTVSNPLSLTNPYGNAPNVASALLQYIQGVPSGTTNYQFVTPVALNNIDPGFTNGYVQQWNFNLQRELVRDFALTAAYVGSKGTHLQILEEVNGAPYIPGNCGSSACSTSGNINNRRLYQPFATIESMESNGFSSYHALQITLKKRFATGYSILMSYTYSHFIDLIADDGHGSTSPSGTDPFYWFYDKGTSDLNIAHRFVTSFVYEPQIFKAATGAKRMFLAGWQLNGIVTLQTGLPFSVTAGVNRSLSGGAGDRANLLGGTPVTTNGGESRGQFIQQYFDTSRFALPALGTFGTAGRNILTGPGLANVDASAFKIFRATEKVSLELRWEVFNVLNRPNFSNPVGSVSSAQFGQITSAGSPRIMQVALKLLF